MSDEGTEKVTAPAVYPICVACGRRLPIFTKIGWQDHLRLLCGEGDAVRHDGLTDRQLEVAVLVAEGLTDKDIAAALTIHVQTVRFHICRIVKAWALSDQRNVRVQIVRRATQQNYRGL